MDLVDRAELAPRAADENLVRGSLAELPRDFPPGRNLIWHLLVSPLLVALVEELGGARVVQAAWQAVCEGGQKGRCA